MGERRGDRRPSIWAFYLGKKLMRPDCLKKAMGLSHTTLVISSSENPRRLISRTVRGTMSGSLGPQSHELLISIFSRPCFSRILTALSGESLVTG